MFPCKPTYINLNMTQSVAIFMTIFFNILYFFKYYANIKKIVKNNVKKQYFFYISLFYVRRV